MKILLTILILLSSSAAFSTDYVGTKTSGTFSFADGDTISGDLTFDPTAGDITINSIDKAGVGCADASYGSECEVGMVTAPGSTVILDDHASNTLTFNSNGTDWDSRTRFVPDDVNVLDESGAVEGSSGFWIEQVDSGIPEWMEFKDFGSVMFSDKVDMTVQNIYVNNPSGTNSSICLRVVTSDAGDTLTVNNYLCRDSGNSSRTEQVAVINNTDLVLTSYFSNYHDTGSYLLAHGGAVAYSFTAENMVNYSALTAGTNTGVASFKNSQFYGLSSEQAKLDYNIDIYASVFNTGGATAANIFGGPNTSTVNFKYNAVLQSKTTFLAGVASSQIMDADYNSMSGCSFGNDITAFDTDECSTNCPAAGISTFHAPCWDMTNFADGGSTCGTDESCVQNAQSSHDHLMSVESVEHTATPPTATTATITFSSATPNAGDSTMALWLVGVCRYGTASGVYTHYTPTCGGNEISPDYCGFYYAQLKDGGNSGIPKASQTHTRVLTDLTASTDYYYQCSGQLGNAGFVTWSTEATFTTAAAATTTTTAASTTACAAGGGPNTDFFFEPRKDRRRMRGR